MEKIWFSHPIELSEFHRSDGFDFYVHRLPLQTKWWERLALRVLRHTRLRSRVQSLESRADGVIVALLVEESVWP